MALPIIMGQNIGTCVTALLSSIGVNRNARRVSVIHISFNLIGTAVCLAAFYGSDLIFHYAFMDLSIGPAGIAMVHSIFNIATTVLLLPFTKQLEKLAYLVVREDQGEGEIRLHRRAPAGDALGGHRGVRQQDRGHGAAGGDYDPAGPHPSGKIR